MTRLAANYSQPLLALIDEQPGIVDAVKVSEFDRLEYVRGYEALVARGIPLVLHGLGQDLTPGTPAFRSAFDPDKLAAAVLICQPAYLSVHLEWRCHEVFPGPDEFLAALACDLATIHQQSGLPVHLENTLGYLKAPPEPHHPPLTGDPEFIAATVEQMGTGLLLDLGHAQVSAWNRDDDAGDYIRRLPLARVEEMHVTGPLFVNGALRDYHGEVDRAGYALLATALQLCPVKTVSLEYGGVGPVYEGKSDRQALRRQLIRLREIITVAAGNAAE